MVKIHNFSPNIFYAEQCNSKSSSFTKGDMQLQNKFDLFGTFSDLPLSKTQRTGTKYDIRSIHRAFVSADTLYIHLLFTSIVNEI